MTSQMTKISWAQRAVDERKEKNRIRVSTQKNKLIKKTLGLDVKLYEKIIFLKHHIFLSLSVRHSTEQIFSLLCV
jgi:hypothetical protein